MNRPVASLALILLSVPCLPALAEEGPILREFRLGIRGGTDSRGKVGHSELAGEVGLPWKLTLGEGWTLGTAVQPSLGMIRDKDHGAVIGSVIPVFRLHSDHLPLSVIGGSGPTLISRNHIGGRNLGTAFQFTTHLGLAWQITGRVEANYRFQHMSNAGLGDTNPGMNEHMFGVSWRF